MLRSSEIKPLFVDLSHSDKSFFNAIFLLGRVSIYFVFLMIFSIRSCIDLLCFFNAIFLLGRVSIYFCFFLMLFFY